MKARIWSPEPELVDVTIGRPRQWRWTIPTDTGYDLTGTAASWGDAMAIMDAYRRYWVARRRGVRS